MKDTQRHKPNVEQPTGQDAGTDIERLNQIREDAQQMLSEADKAITAALSANSQTFVEGNRQAGGQ